MARGQTLPPLAERYHRTQQLEVLAASEAAARAWQTLPRDIDAGWPEVHSRLMAVNLTAQQRVTARTPGYVSGVLRATGQGASDNPIAAVTPRPLLGFAGDGRALWSLLALAPIRTKILLRQGVSPASARLRTEQWLRTVTETVTADTARASEKLDMAIRRVAWYVRVVNEGACSRCAILAGARYRMQTAFERHENCRCDHIPAGSESDWEPWQMDTSAYFDSLAREEQDRIFTRAGAEAIRSGADPARVVNARRGMRPAQVNGRQVHATTEATTRGGSASRLATGRRGTVRLMPESIIEIAGADTGELVRLLRLHGYIAP